MSIQHKNERAAHTSFKSPEASPRPLAKPAERNTDFPRERVNRRFLAILFVGTLVFAVVWYGVNRWQVDRHATNLLVQADVMESQDRLDRAARYVGLYVSLVPTDTEARVRYGLLLERLALAPRGRAGALAVFEQVLIRDPGRTDIRRRAAVLAVGVGQYANAIQHLNQLSGDMPKDAELQDLMGQATEGRADYKQAASSYQAAIKTDPHRITSYLRLARLQRDHLGQSGEPVEKTLASLIKNNDKEYKAYLGRARIRLEGTPDADMLQAAKRDMQEALRLAPDEQDVLLGSAEAAARLPNGNGMDEARKHLKRALELNPKFIQGYEALARVELLAGRSEEAIAVFRHGLEKDKLPDQPELVWNLTNLLIQRGKLDEAEKLLGQVDKLPVARPRRDFLRAALKLRRGDWMAARKALEAVRPLITSSRELAVQCDLLLAECCELAGEREIEIVVCRRAIALDAQQTGARLRLVLSLQRLGRLDEALSECQRMMSTASPPPVGWTLLARLLINQNFRRPAGQQQWEEVDRVLERAAKAGADAGEIALLKADTLMAHKDTQSASKALEQARTENPKAANLWLASMDLAFRDGKPELARKMLEEAQKKLSDGAALRLVRLRYIVGTDDSVKNLRTLEADLDKLSNEDHGRVLYTLGEVHFQIGRPDEARRIWTEAARIRPQDLDTRLRLFDVALQGKDAAAVNETLAAIRTVEGEGGTLGRYNEARRLIWQASQGDKSGLATARADLEAVSKKRPGWSRVSLCMAETWDLEGNEERALELYLHAIELGERQLELIRRVVRLLHDRGRFTEADLVLQRLPEQALAFGNMPQLVAEVSMQSGNYARTLAAAKQAIKSGSKDPREYIWLGQVLWLAAQRADVPPEQRRSAEAEAEKALYQAVELGAKTPETWVALAQHLVRTKQKDKAEALIDKARAALPAEQSALALAQCYAALAKQDKAREFFAAALKARPEETTVLQIAGDFYLQTNDMPAAERCLRQLIEGEKRDRAAAAKARALLAVVLASKGGEKTSKEALELLTKRQETGSQPESAAEAVQRERAQAVVLSMKPQLAEQRKAIDILERLSSKQPLSPEDRFLLVQLYDRTGNSSKARDRMLPLLKSGNARYLGYHISALLRQGLTVEAEAWMTDMEKLEPDSLRTDALKAQLLKAQGKGKEAGPMLKHRAEGQEPPTVLVIAVLLEDVGCPADAINLYRQYSEKVKKPEAVLPLARCLGRQNQIDEALKLCESVWSKCPQNLVIAASLDILQAGRPEDKQFERVERRLKEALEKDRTSIDVLISLGSFNEIRGRYKEAEMMYQQALERDPRNVVALNNLAWLLALREGKGDEALTYINRAIDMYGSMPELLDTRAVASLVAGKATIALTDLKDALAHPNLDPKVRFSITVHLVQTHLRSGDKANAKRAWQEAHSHDVRADTLHALDRDNYEKLLREMGTP